MTSYKKNAKVAPFFGTENLAMSNAVETQADSQDQQGQKGDYLIASWQLLSS
ncbi:hypothetical protein [Pseudoalteromonas piscicida]|uniref:hypothetical protein n=1 Tax=Pseudoalteromonas piscicida TaxID=43662 RepID=UPI001E4B04DA|nr:hypothetical protein [Pseudoalteromonas piscicida]